MGETLRVPGLGCWCGHRFRVESQARDLNLCLNTRTRYPMAETLDLKMGLQPIIQFPVSL